MRSGWLKRTAPSCAAGNVARVRATGRRIDLGRLLAGLLAGLLADLPRRALAVDLLLFVRLVAGMGSSGTTSLAGLDLVNPIGLVRVVQDGQAGRDESR
jgi:hypothetical protein